MFKNVYYTFLEYILNLQKYIEATRSNKTPNGWGKGDRGEAILVTSFQEIRIALKTPIFSLIDCESLLPEVANNLQADFVGYSRIVESQKALEAIRHYLKNNH